MKKVLFVVLAICALFASIAAAPMQTSVTLVGVSNGGGGPMFTFRVNGPVNLNNGIVHSVEGEYQGDFPLFCKQENETTVICHATKKLSGDWVTVEFGGSRFWVSIPQTPEPSYCYDYYNSVSGVENNEVSSQKSNWYWSQVATLCQDKPAEKFDHSKYNNQLYFFIEEGAPDGNNYNPGPAYYLAMA